MSDTEKTKTVLEPLGQIYCGKCGYLLALIHIGVKGELKIFCPKCVKYCYLRFVNDNVSIIS